MWYEGRVLITTSRLPLLSSTLYKRRPPVQNTFRPRLLLRPHSSTNFSKFLNNFLKFVGFLELEIYHFQDEVSGNLSRINQPPVVSEFLFGGKSGEK